jgi:uncharacterized membrane protein YfcA
MESMKDIFYKVSYLQYPCMLIAVFFAFKPFFNELHGLFDSLGNTLLFMGLAIGFSSLQDTTKTQNNFSLKVWQNPKKGRWCLIVIFSQAAIMMSVGSFGIYFSPNEMIKELAVGFFVLGVGFIAMLKSAAEMRENLRLDKVKEAE